MPGRTRVERLVDAVRALPPGVILVAGWLAIAGYGFPGQMSPAAFAYLRQARGRFFSDDHAPALSTLWRVLELVVAGPTGMLVLQSALFVIGVSAILRPTLGRRAAAWATAALCGFPPLLASAAMISSHVVMASLLVIGIAALLADRPRGGLAALCLATAVQPSAAVATLPLLIGLSAWHPGMPRARRLVRVVTAWVAITAAAVGLDLVFAKQPTRAWHSALAAHDVAGTLAFLDSTPDRELLDGTGIAERSAHAAYRADDAGPSRALFDLPADGSVAPLAQRIALARAARGLALDHPGAYLQHRLSVLGELLWITDRHPERAVPDRELPDSALSAGVPTRASAAQEDATSVLRALAEHTPLFAPWTYLLIALLLLPLAREHRDVVALLASGIAFEASLLVTASGADYRQSHWLIASTCLAAILIAVRRSRP